MRPIAKPLLAVGFLGVLLGVVQNVGLAQRGSSNSPVIGVWRITESTYTGPNARTVTNPQPRSQSRLANSINLPSDFALSSYSR